MLPDERFRFLDAATEFPVLRLTSPEHTSRLAAPWQRVVSRKRSFLLYSNDRTGSAQLYQMMLDSGEARLLGTAADLDVSSPALSPDDRNALYFDGPSLRQVALGNLRERELYRVRQGWRRGAGFSLSADGTAAVLVETDGATWHVRRVALTAREPEAVTLAEAREAIADPLVRPGRQDVIYRQGEGTLMFAGAGAAPRALPLAAGGLGPAFWAGAGESIVYLNIPGAGRLNALRAFAPETGSDQLISATSQFAAFSPNADATVFIGASGSKAAPYLLLLLRVVRRELTVCEHRSSEPARVAPIFSPDSQRAYFQSDRHGRPAIYAVDLERLVNDTAEE
ncbi:MAG TPA: oligogalacturonate lyase family protein [Bryobacteraceae bacterium]